MGMGLGLDTSIGPMGLGLGIICKNLVKLPVITRLFTNTCSLFIYNLVK